MELSTFNIKKIPYIFSKGSFSYIFSKERIYYISRNGTLQFSVQALKIKELHSGKICYTSGNKNTEKNYLKVKQSFLKSKLFFCFQKKNYISGNGTYISGKVYSDTFRTLVHSKP